MTCALLSRDGQLAADCATAPAVQWCVWALSHRKRRRSSASSSEKPFQQLLKGFKAMVHEKALLTVEVAALRAENHHQKQKRVRKKATIQQGGSLTVQQGLELV
jgi:hypothetical protein